MLDSVHGVPRRETETKSESAKAEKAMQHTPIKYNQEASLDFVSSERRRRGILAYL